VTVLPSPRGCTFNTVTFITVTVDITVDIITVDTVDSAARHRRNNS